MTSLFAVCVRLSQRRFQACMKLAALMLLTSSALCPSVSFADTPSFTNLSSSDFNNAMQDFSAHTSFSSVSPASSRGSIFGFELGAVGGSTSTPNINTLAQRSVSTASVSSLPSAGLLGAISAFSGWSLEAVYVPSTTVSGITYAYTGGALQWTFTDTMPIVPFSLAVKGFYSNETLSFSQTINNSSTGNTNVNATINYSNTVTGVDLMASKDLFFIEPYAGVGYALGNGSIGVTGTSTASVFLPSFTSAQSASSTPSSSRLILGAQFKVLVFRLAAEYMSTFGTTRYNAKLTLGF